MRGLTPEQERYWWNAPTWLRDRVQKMEQDAREWADASIENGEALDRLEKCFEEALSLAEHLFAMIPREVWRDAGGDDGQGHYEGYYRAEQIEMELIRLREES